MPPENKEKYHKVLRIGLVVFIAVIVANIVSGNLGYSNNFNNNQPANVVTVTGHGEVQAVSDIANVSFTIRKEASAVKDAQTAVAGVETKVLAALFTDGMDKKDIKTESVSFNPKYQYKATICNQFNCPGNSVIVGYEAYETITLKIRNVDTVGKIVQDLGALGVSELSGPNFAVDKQDSLKDQARKMAIDDAKAKAKVLGKDLGVHLSKITSFTEGGNYPVPMYATAKAMDSAVGAAAPAVLPTGENTIASDVTITYEIK